MKKILCFFAVCLTLFAFSCTDNADFNDKMIVFEGEFDSKPYITALANENYYMDYSLYYGGMIISNTIAVRDGTLESRSDVNGSVSHTLLLDGATYFLDDDDKVYFKADVSEGDGLYSSIDYSTAEYITSGKGDLMIGSGYSYDEFSCKTVYGEDCTVKIFMGENKSFVAIVDSMGENSIERDIAAFSSEIPEGWLKIPEGYTLVGEDTYFDHYYGD